MRRWYPLIALPLLLAAGASQAQMERKTIVWMRSSFTPITIVEGPDQDQGYVDRWLALVEGRLPDYRYYRVTATTQRAMDEMKTRPNICSPAFLKTPEREALFVYSKPYLQMLPNGMVTTQAKLDALKPFLDKSGQLRLDALLGSERFRVAAQAQRSYGAVIDQALAAHDRAVTRQHQQKTLTSNLKAMATNRADFDGYLGYAVEFEYYVRQLDIGPHLFAFLPVAGQPLLLPAYLACSRSPEGEAFIRRVDALMDDPALQQQTAAYYRAWLPPAVARYWDRIRPQR